MISPDFTVAVVVMTYGSRTNIIPMNATSVTAVGVQVILRRIVNNNLVVIGPKTPK
jgi:hypothetical protein